MKTLLLIAALSVTTLAVAQDAPPPAQPDVGTAPGLVTLLSPLIVSLVIWGVRKVAPKIPGWVIPLVAPVLSVGVEYVQTAMLHHDHNFILAAVLGLAAVGLNQAKRQLSTVVSVSSSSKS